jgi:Domain of unknown function (DUF4112)
MRAKSELDIHNIKADVEQACRRSDKLIGIGPVGIGLDGILTFVPVVGQVYTLGVAAYLLTQGVKARVSGITLWQMGALFLTDFALGAVPIVGAVPDMIFCAHLWAGWMLKRAIDRTTYVARDDDPRISTAVSTGQRVVLLAAK